MQLYTVDRTAELMGVTRQTIYRLYWQGRLAFVKIGKATRIADTELARFVEANQHFAKPKPTPAEETDTADPAAEGQTDTEPEQAQPKTETAEPTPGEQPQPTEAGTPQRHRSPLEIRAALNRSSILAPV